jgi:hypothetical protein
MFYWTKMAESLSSPANLALLSIDSLTANTRGVSGHLVPGTGFGEVKAQRTTHLVQFPGFTRALPKKLVDRQRA